MFDRILKKLRDLVRAQQYVMTTHADEEMYDDALTIRDVENAVLTGQITARQKNDQVGVWKYLVQGRSADGRTVVAVVKVSLSGKLVIITVYVG